MRNGPRVPRVPAPGTAEGAETRCRIEANSATNPNAEPIGSSESLCSSPASPPQRSHFLIRSGPPRLVLEVLLWLVGRYSEQGVMLHVCSKALQRRPFGMTSSEVGARRALGAVGGAWRDSATMCYSGPGAGRSGGVLPGPVALRALEVASYRRSRGQGSGSTTHL